MTAVLSNTVLDAALTVIASSCNKAQVRASASSILVNSITLDGANFGSIGDNSSSGGGRKVQCLVSSSSDMKAISVSSAGAAKKVVLLKSSTIHAVGVLSSAVSLAASDQVNLSTFYVILKDPS